MCVLERTGELETKGEGGGMSLFGRTVPGWEMQARGGGVYFEGAVVANRAWWMGGGGAMGGSAMFRTRDAGLYGR